MDAPKSWSQPNTVMDELHRRLFTVTQAPQWPHGVQAAVDVTLLGRFYERFCDHTVDIGRRIIFLETGQLPPDRNPSLTTTLADHSHKSTTPETMNPS